MKKNYIAPVLDYIEVKMEEGIAAGSGGGEDVSGGGGGNSGSGGGNGGGGGGNGDNGGWGSGL